MRCPNCKELMKKDEFFESITSEPNWRTRKGIKYICNNHCYETTLTIETKNNKFIEALFHIENTIVDKILLFFLDYKYINCSVLERKFKR